VEHEAEFRALLRPSASDYDELLRNGNVFARPDDVAAWRTEIRAQARADKISVRTGTSSSDPEVAWAAAEDISTNLAAARSVEGGDASGFRALDLAYELAGAGHEARAIRSEHGQQAWVCKTCHALGYVDWRPEPPILDGPLFEDACTGEE
jgi:hypothetical protein